jgi:hypothetical protein
MSLDKFTLLLDNMPVNVSSYDINYDMFQGAGQFSADVDHTKMIDITRKAISFEIRIDDMPMMIGFLEKVGRSYSKGQLSQTVSGRDMMQVLIDNYIMQPQVYPGKPEKVNSLQELFGDSSAQKAISITDLINNIWLSSKTIKGTASVDLGGKIGVVEAVEALNLPAIDFPNYASNAADHKLFEIKRIRTGHGQTMFEFMSHLLNGLGLYMYNVPGTNKILIHAIQASAPVISYDRACIKIDDKPYAISNVAGSPGNNVISGKIDMDCTEYYKFLRFVGQCQSEDVLESDSGPSYLIVERIESGDVFKGYTGTKKFKCTTLNLLDNNVWLKEQDRLINNEFMQQNKRLYGFQYTLSGHSPDGHTPYFFNHAAVVSDDYMHMNNQTLLTHAVQFKGSKSEGQTTVLSLYSPSEIPKMISYSDIPFSLDKFFVPVPEWK